MTAFAEACAWRWLRLREGEEKEEGKNEGDAEKDGVVEKVGDGVNDDGGADAKNDAGDGELRVYCDLRRSGELRALGTVSGLGALRV